MAYNKGQIRQLKTVCLQLQRDIITNVEKKVKIAKKEYIKVQYNNLRT